MTTPSTTTVITTGSGTNSEDEDGWPSSSTTLPDSLSPATAKHFQMEKRGVTLVWQDLSIYVPAQKKGFFGKIRRNRPYKRILNNVTGIVYPGSLVAIMGSSGSGKTTLMDVLAYKAPSNVSVTGQMFINGIQTGEFMSSISGYVYQKDLFHVNLTVSEHLYFMARMKMDRRLRQYERDRRIEELMQELSLKKCENSRILTISGGEKKRLAFACEVLTDPPLLFLDEATTGLDSLSAQKLVTMMKHMTMNGKTIICTIHQPSSQVFAMFDQLCVLAEGRMAYMGKATEAFYFLKDLDFICPQHFNPADFYIQTLSVQPGQEESSRIRIKSICDNFVVSLVSADLDERVNEELVNCKEITESLLTSDSLLDKYLLGKHHVRRPRWVVRTLLLTGRAFRQSYRNQTYHKFRLIFRVVLALIIGLSYMGTWMTGVQNTQGVLLILINELSFSAMAAVMTVFPLEFPVFIREHKSGLYDVNSYYISKLFSMLPVLIIDPFVYTTIIYWISGLRGTAYAYLLSSLIVVVAINVAAACGSFISATFNNISINSVALFPFTTLMLISGGLYINVKSLPIYIVWAKYISWFFYAMESMSILQWQDVKLGACLPNSSLANGTCFTTGEQVLDSYGYDIANFYYDFIALASIYLVFHILAYNSILIRSRRY